jgi:hypothetical protein
MSFVQGVMQFVGIVLLCVLAAVVYGIVHDQITARICVEYFTVFHPPVIESDSPTLQGLVWGVIATWWVGLGLGVPLAIAARAGAWPQRDIAWCVRPVTILMLICGACALIAGLVAYLLQSSSALHLSPSYVQRLPSGHRYGFLIAAFAHNASYASGFIGGWILIFGTAYGRWRESRRRR